MKKLAWLLLVFCCLPVTACTTFVLKGGRHIYFGRNLDWEWDSGMVLVNPRNLQKRAFVSAPNAVTWTAKYGSLTFNQFGRELPFGGMNEAGLVVENMWLDGTQYPAADARPEINMLQWIQYQLDTCSNVAQVIASDKIIRLENTPVRARIHYLVCDTQGHSASIEFLDGAMRVREGQQLPYAALANSTYADSEAALKANPQLGNLARPITNPSSINRFCRAAARARAFKPGKTSAQDIAYAFDTLDQVRQGNYTAWQMVYDVTARQVVFRTRSNPRGRRVDLKALDFNCGRALGFADIQADGAADGTLGFHELTEAIQRQNLAAFYGQDSLKQTVGDCTPLVEPLLFTLRSYHCATP